MKCAAVCMFSTISGLASASPVTYTIDPNHTHPEFETDHLGGVSIWRGLFKRTSGTIVLDAAAKTGTVDVLTLHDITRPVALQINSFKCVVDLPATQKHVCGADAVGTFNRADFGINIGQRYGFKMEVTIHIQVEAFAVS
jgi:polyisoprenoid-binding protein YceI